MPLSLNHQILILGIKRKLSVMENNPREIDWLDSSDFDEGEDMEQVQENLAYQNFPPPDSRPAHAPIVSLNHPFRKFKVSRLQSIIDHYWYLRGPVRVVGRVKRYYVIHFDMEEDRQHILNEGPWAMQGGLLTMFPWEPNLVLSNLLVTEVAVWVQLWNLPLEYQTPLMAEKIGSLMGERQWVQDHFENAYGTMIDQAYFVPEARRFCFQPGRRTTYIRALYTRHGFQYRPRRADPVDFYFDPWVPLDAHGNMNPPTQEMLNLEDPISQDPEWQRLVEQYCPPSTPVQFPLPGIRINESRHPEDRAQAALNWVEFTPGEYGLALGWPMDGDLAPIFDELSPIQHTPTETELEEMWKEIYDAPDDLTNNERTFEKGESSQARENHNIQLEDGMRESMTGGTLTFLPPPLGLPPFLPRANLFSLKNAPLFIFFT
ncbi:Endonuclease/exonuclease/phosphatase [Senna tora]|uniref:Endonuclease/exonuclease/phosphatase n=1 Tax=Senna tora TaxID=362788 RepID=A0A834TTN5_9FABA|nr:Endonuclease/exonuclease/phosphatase [Senna tora]